jgi:hypothetical protein
MILNKRNQLKIAYLKYHTPVFKYDGKVVLPFAMQVPAVAPFHHFSCGGPYDSLCRRPQHYHRYQRTNSLARRGGGLATNYLRWKNLSVRDEARDDEILRKLL